MRNSYFINTQDYETALINSKKKIKNNNKIVLITNNGTKISIRNNIFDIKIVNEQFKDYQYFPKDVFNEKYKPKTIIDIGGYIGDFTLYCAGELGCDVHCYEPTPQNFEMLKANIDINTHMNNIKIFNEGVSKNSGILKINVQDLSGEIHASSNKNYSNETTINIPVVGLKTVMERINKPVDILKIDCEGEEFNILSKEIIDSNVLDNVHYIIFEYHKFVEDFDSKMKILLENLDTKFELIKKTKYLCYYKNKNL